MGLGVLLMAASAALQAVGASAPAAETKAGQVQVIESQWKGKKVAYLGDSITDKRHVGTASNYWQYLDVYLGTEAWVYGINGADWNGLLGQAQKLKAEKGESVDAIIVFAGTNDYNGGVPLGDWWSTTNQLVECWGKKTEARARRLPNRNPGTFRGRINVALDYLKTNFPRQQIVLLTPIHRGYATFGGGNIQPEESYPNARGLYIGDYVDAVKEAANVWAVPVIDLNSVSGLYPLNSEHLRYFHDAKTDRLHPNAAGHERMARALAYQLLAYPADFK
jgi:lysophospholipase L1-like esterase